MSFKRYDYRMDPITDQWLSLEELREKVRNLLNLYFYPLVLLLLMVYCRQYLLTMHEANATNLLSSARKETTKK